MKIRKITTSHGDAEWVTQADVHFLGFLIKLVILIAGALERLIVLHWAKFHGNWSFHCREMAMKCKNSLDGHA